MIVDKNIVQSKIHFYLNLWNREIINISKLRINYILFKTVFGIENYVISDTSKHLQSSLFQFRFGIVHVLLRIKTSRYHGEPIEERIYTFYCKNSKENEIHFLLHCLLYVHIYNDCRKILSKILDLINYILPEFPDPLIVLISKYSRHVAKYIIYYSNIAPTGRVLNLCLLVFTSSPN